MYVCIQYGKGLINEAKRPAQKLKGQRVEGAYFREDTVFTEYNMEGFLNTVMSVIRIWDNLFTARA